MSRNQSSKTRSKTRSPHKHRRSSGANQKKLPKSVVECEIIRLGHDGRGIAKCEGKTQFVDGALPGETVKARYTGQRAKFDELKTIDVVTASEERVIPPCKHIDVCGGCNLQHMSSSAQLHYKQNVLLEQFQHFGNITPDQWLDPILSNDDGYRSKARLGVYFDTKQNKVSLGFREKQNRQIADIDDCYVLDRRIANHLQSLRSVIGTLSSPQIVTHLEVAAGDQTLALVVRHVEPLEESDSAKIIEFARLHQFDLYFQPGDSESTHKVWPENSLDRLSYHLPLSESQTLPENKIIPENKSMDSIDIRFHPKDFTQVNLAMNRKMVQQAIECLELKKTDRVLDLFCGLGNFTLPMALYAQEVVGVEGNPRMVQRGFENARLNGIDNVSFFSADLQSDFTRSDFTRPEWAAHEFDKILIDPPRSGAFDIVNYLHHFKARRVVYISCNPATLARDSGVLIDKGYTLLQAGVMDMFPHTAHVESIALFEKRLK